MTNQEEWNGLLENLFNNALQKYQDSKECKYLKEKQEQMNARLSEKEIENREFLENCAFEMGLDDERKIEFIYREAMKDCVWILKKLGVIV